MPRIDVFAGRLQPPSTRLLLDAVHRGVEPQRDAGLAGVVTAVLDHLVAGWEGRSALRIGPTRKVREVLGGWCRTGFVG